MKYSGGSWQTVGTAGFYAGFVQYVFLAIDSSGTPYVSFEDWGIPGFAHDGTATVMKYAGGSWQTVGTAGMGAGESYRVSVAFDSIGTPYIAYLDAGRPMVRKYVGGSWQFVGTAGFTGRNTGSPSLAIDSLDSPYVAFPDTGTSGVPCKATVMKYTGGSWQTVGTAGFTAGRANDVSLALDSIGIPYVAYQDEANSYKATVMRFK
jgi:hypothetical protein